MQYSRIFGPVQSRRLGRSLGIDLVPEKTCSFDCVYCECGHTTVETTGRCEFFPVADVLSEISDYLSGSPDLDFITFSGSGEPTLSTSIGPVIRYLKRHFPRYPLAVITNGSFLWDPDVREALLPADVVLPTLSSVFGSTYQLIQRPAAGIPVERIVDGLEQFREEFRGEIWLEIFLIPGINTDNHELAGLCHAIQRIHPDRVQLNTLDRPGTEGWVRPASSAELGRIRDLLQPCSTGPVEPVGTAPAGIREGDPSWSEGMARVEALIRHHPCTLDDLSEATGLSPREIVKILRAIQVHTEIRERREERGVTFTCPW